MALDHHTMPSSGPSATSLPSAASCALASQTLSCFSNFCARRLQTCGAVRDAVRDDVRVRAICRVPGSDRIRLRPTSVVAERAGEACVPGGGRW